MAWDSSRPIPWARLFREWLVYAVVMIVVFVALLRDSVTAGSVLGLAASFPLYITFGAVLAKFGYQRKTLRDLRSTPSTSRSSNAENRGSAGRDANGSPTGSPHKPRPTRRTSTGPSQHRPKNARKRR